LLKSRGGSKPVPVNIRIIATSNRDLQKTVAEGNFREDLYFRLNVINLELPPLRDRGAEIPELTDLFVAKYAKANGVPPLSVSDAALEKLKKHHWPGNIRELENTCHRAVLMATGGEIGVDAIMLSGARPAVEGAPKAEVADAPANAEEAKEDGANVKALLGRTVASVERELILDTVEHCLGNRTHAANILGISIRTLRNKLKIYNEEGHDVPAGQEDNTASGT